MGITWGVLVPYIGITWGVLVCDTPLCGRSAFTERIRKPVLVAVVDGDLVARGALGFHPLYQQLVLSPVVELYTSDLRDLFSCYNSMIIA